MKRTFVNKKHLNGKAFRLQGSGTFTVSVDFQADFILATFVGGRASKDDTLTWDFVAVSDGWEFSCNYVCAKARDISYVVAKLPKNGEYAAF